MSKIANAIDLVYTGRVKISPMSPSAILTVDHHISTIDHITDMRELKLSASFQVKGFARDSKDVQHLKDVARRAIIEEAFGEFRPLLIRLEVAISRYEVDEARAALRELWNEMYS